MRVYIYTLTHFFFFWQTSFKENFIRLFFAIYYSRFNYTRLKKLAIFMLSDKMSLSLWWKLINFCFVYFSITFENTEIKIFWKNDQYFINYFIAHFTKYKHNLKSLMFNYYNLSVLFTLTTLIESISKIHLETF